MNLTSQSTHSAGLGNPQFGDICEIPPVGKHVATVVWLHGLGDRGSSWGKHLQDLQLPNIKWICPTAPYRPVTLFSGCSTTSWFDVSELSENSVDDLVGMDAAAKHVSNLLSMEPPEIQLGIGGFSMGAATALYSAICFSQRKLANDKLLFPKLDVIVGLSGWLPCYKSLESVFKKSNGESNAKSLPILLCHGQLDNVVAHEFGRKSYEIMHSMGFPVEFRSYQRLDHNVGADEMKDISGWLTSRLHLEGV